MKKRKSRKESQMIAVVTAVAVGGVSVGGYYGIRQAQKTTVKVYPVSDFTSGYWEDSMNMEGQITSTASQEHLSFRQPDHFPGFSSKRAMW